MKTAPRTSLARRAVTIAGAAAFAACVLGVAMPQGRAADAFNADQRREMETVIHDYLMKNPQVVIDALNAYQAQQRDQASKKFSDSVGKYKDFLTGADAPSAGNPKGDVTVVEFFDYNCGYCKHAVDDVVKLVDQDKNVRVVFKDYPILAPSSDDAARYALAAQRQGKYYEFHQKLMKYPGPRDENGFRSVAKDVGLDFDKLKKDADSPEIKAEIEKNKEIGRDLGIDGTPAFIFGTELVPGYISVDTMKQMVNDARKKKS
jgi:protein-disulfide isomerase